MGSDTKPPRTIGPVVIIATEYISHRISAMEDSYTLDDYIRENGLEDSHSINFGDFLGEFYSRFPLRPFTLTVKHQFGDIESSLRISEQWIAQEQESLFRKIEDSMWAEIDYQELKQELLNSDEKLQACFESRDELSEHFVDREAFKSFLLTSVSVLKTGIAVKVWMDAHEDRWLFGDYMPQIFRATHFLASYVVLERALFDLCKVVEEQGFSSGKKLDDYEKDIGVKKCKRYLEETIGVSSFGTPLGEEIDHYHQIRNIVSHEGVSGCIYLKDEQLEWAREYPALRVLSNNEVEFTDRFVPQVIKTINKFFGALVEELKGLGYK